ncbi:MAG: hypothetical protein V7752_02510 [Halopseudomonas sp.]
MQITHLPLTLGLSAMLILPVAHAQPQLSDSANRTDASTLAVDNSRHNQTNSDVDIAIDNSHRSSQANRQALTRQYLMDQQYRSSQQQQDEQRDYNSAVGQAAGNNGQARGHQLDQQQGGISVGSLVTEQNSDNAPAVGGFNWQYAPQSNTLSVEGDNNAPIQLSNINANGGNIHIGDVNKGNLYNSQIGNNQHGSQGGDSANVQSNEQQQQADSQVSSRDRATN